MDMIQIFGDYLHLLGMIILLMKLLLTKNCAGVSGKSQLLHALVSTTRYLDVTVVRISLYETIQKLLFIAMSWAMVITIYLSLHDTYDRKRDGFRMELLVLPSAVLALFINRRFETFEVLGCFGAYLEAVAIVPQVYLVSKSKRIDSVIVSYVACLGLYQGCYLMHWLLVYAREPQRPVNIDLACAIVQLIFYADFFGRNLPIIKAKDAPVQQELATRSASRSPKLVVATNVKDETDRTMDGVIVVKPNDHPAAPEKVTLLASTAKPAETSGN